MIPEQPIDTRFPRATVPVGSVVTLLDRDRRTVFPAVAALRLHEALVAAGETGRWRVRYAGLRLIKAGPTGGATMREVGDHAAQLLERHLNTNALATRWRFRFETATGRAGICRHDARTIALSVSFVVGPGHAHDAVWRTAARRIGCTAKRCSTVPHSLKRWNRGVPAVPGPVVPPPPDGASTPTPRSARGGARPSPGRINAHREGR